VKPLLPEILACPSCRGALETVAAEAHGDEVVSGTMTCRGCGASYPVRDGIPRFVPQTNYADNFGFQWNRFSRTQLDSHSGAPISRDRLVGSTGWSWSGMKGKRILDVGCGAGRFAEVALQSGATVVGLDYSSAIDAARRNLAAFPDFHAVQGSVYELPFRPGTFDYVYCLGVLQHTPDPDGAFAKLPEMLARGGRIAVDVYPRLWMNVFWSKFWLRPITKKLPGETLFRLVQKGVPSLLAVSRAVSAIPLVGRKLKYLLPVVNYEGVYALSETQLREWAVLDTFDMLSPAHDHPKSEATVRRWFRNANLTDVEVFRKGHVVGRGRAP
jgi:2-polyprenyl-3-methyl-5-hydroxy-6-metoxy-1,4-benzoquinol methylase/uncharacterized protein YbaR (Trm112 family)